MKPSPEVELRLWEAPLSNNLAQTFSIKELKISVRAGGGTLVGGQLDGSHSVDGIGA